MNAHTPTTWVRRGMYVWRGHVRMAAADSIERADEIVRACNAHEKLVAELREAERIIPELVRQLPSGAPMTVAAAHDRIRAALQRIDSELFTGDEQNDPDDGRGVGPDRYPRNPM